jgi:quinol monooxygenase YgiN
MITLIAKLKAKQGKEKLLAEECVKMAAEVREKEEGCLLYVPYVSLEDPSEIVFIEKYVDQIALDYHRQTSHLKALRQVLAEVLAEPVGLQEFRE